MTHEEENEVEMSIPYLEKLSSDPSLPMNQRAAHPRRPGSCKGGKMSDLYLIAHKVRGEPAFDVAARMECPECQGLGQRDCDDTMCECSECDSLGYWWIIPTSGHRAYPYWNCSLDDLAVAEGNMEYYSVSASVTEMPPDLPDHYAHTSSGRPQIDINGLIGLSKTFSSKHRRH